MQISELLSEQYTVVGIPPGDKKSVISNLIDVLKGHPSVKDLEAVRTAVHDREAVMSTGVGNGLAIPHAKTSAVDDTVAVLAVTQGPVEFDAIDGEPVRILFLLVGTPESKSSHVRILSRISRLMNLKRFREQLLSAETGSDLLSFLSDRENQLRES